MTFELPSDDQAALVQGCGYCRVLHPDTVDCPRCHGRTSLEAARMLDEDGIAGEVRDVVRRFAADPGRVNLDALLRCLVVYGSPALRTLDALGSPTLEALRRVDRRLVPDMRGRTEGEVRASLGDPSRQGAEEWTYSPSGPHNHERRDAVLIFRGGRVVEQREIRVRVDCDTVQEEP